jgi:hypothetical protein
MDADTKNDGDPMTTHPILHGSTKTYRLLAKNAGTYLYHCHVEDVVHVQMGMYGLIIVKAAGGAKTAWTGGPSFNSTYHWLTSEIDKSWHDTIPQAKNDTLRVPAYHPNYFLVNGKSEQQIDADDSIKIRGSQNEFIYLRIANIGYFNNRVIFPAGLKAKMIDSDGRPLPHALVRDTVELLPGERYGMMLNPLTQFTDSVKISYVNCNTDSVWNNQYIPVIISGIYAVNSIDHPAWFSVFPNPAKEVINLQNNTGKIYSNASVCLINLLGETVMEEKKETFNQTVSLHISHVPSGLYYLQINVGNEVYRKKIIISK